MPVKRRVAKTRQRQITPTAVDLFKRMDRLECTCKPLPYPKYTPPCAGCDEWWELHAELWREVGAKLWAYPCIEVPTPENRKQYPDQVALYEELQRLSGTT
jgi:hypothetical protein